jgi:pimeloyl-ACP methyl ester carboxylesterase
MGQGEPTIIFDAGYGSVSSDWRAVEAILAPHNKVCTYDRAGMGHSDGQSRRTTPSNVVDDLHRLIQNSHMKTPIVLVGHSRGGLYDTLYALTYRSELAAMVLVDPVVAQNNAQMLAISPSERAFLNSGSLEQKADLVRCEGLAKAHEVTAADPHGCYSFSSLDTPATRADAVYQGAKPEHYQALISEQEAALAGVDTAKIIGAERKNAHPFGNLPLIVLTSSKPRQIGGPNAADDGAVDKIWKDDHELLANESLAGRSLIVPNSSHLIALDHPQSVADAVNTVLQECCRVK